jgi:hypothetical protein
MLTHVPVHVQVAGFKYVRLYALSESERLYPTILRAANTNR